MREKDILRIVFVMWFGESGCLDVGNFDFDVSRIIKNFKKSL